MKKIILLGLSLLSNHLFSQQLEPTETEALLSVIVQNFKGKPLQGETVSFLGMKTKKIFSGVTNDQGKFSILIPEGEKYKVQYKSFTEDKEYKDLDIPSMAGVIEFDYTLMIDDLPRTYTLNNVFFDTGKSTLRPESFKELNTLAEFMRLKKALFIEVSGHTDNVGNKDENQKLSEERANTVRAYLLKKGITTERVIAKGYGDAQPVETNDTPVGKQKNRRTEVRIIKQ